MANEDVPRGAPQTLLLFLTVKNLRLAERGNNSVLSACPLTSSHAGALTHVYKHPPAHAGAAPPRASSPQCLPGGPHPHACASESPCRDPGGSGTDVSGEAGSGPGPSGALASGVASGCAEACAEGSGAGSHVLVLNPSSNLMSLISVTLLHLSLHLFLL